MHPLLSDIEYHKKLDEAIERLAFGMQKIYYAFDNDVINKLTSKQKCPCGQCEICLCHKPEKKPE